MHHVFSFGAYESCGKCTPCCLGNSRIEAIFGEIIYRGSRSTNRLEVGQIIDALRMTSLCGLGTGLAEFAASVERYYGEELERCFA